MLNLGKKIRKSRDQTGYTQERLAEAIGVTRSSVAQYESGEKEPTVEHLAEIAKNLRVSSDYLLGIENETLSSPQMSTEARIALEQFIEAIKKEESK